MNSDINIDKVINFNQFQVHVGQIVSLVIFPAT